MLTAKQAFKALDEVIEEQGADKTAENRYFVDGRAHCIIAHMVQKIAGKRAVHKLVEGISVVAQLKVLVEIFGGLEPGLANFLQYLQDHQDNGEEWGHALELAKDEYLLDQA